MASGFTPQVLQRLAKLGWGIKWDSIGGVEGSIYFSIYRVRRPQRRTLAATFAGDLLQDSGPRNT